MDKQTQARKLDHIKLCLEREVEFQSQTTMFEDVNFVGTALPEVDPGEVDLTVEFLGRRLRAPILIGAMTGGTEESRRINEDFARVAADLGIGLALGSQRAMLENPALAESYQVRRLAPDILLLGNIGLSQAFKMPPSRARELMEAIGADGMCLHLNAAMEMCQPEGERHFAGGLAVIRCLADELGERLIIKETGGGFSRQDGERLRQAGARVVDVAGAGGTSWTRVERLRSRRGGGAGSAPLDEWGIPTAASLLELRGRGLELIASGGLRSGMDFAKGIALGASMCGAALPFLRALARGGVDGARHYAQSLAEGVRLAAALTGSRNLAALRAAPLVFTGRLREWAEQRL